MSLNHHIQARFGLAGDIGNATAENSTVTNILARRSHRAFSEQEIPEDLLSTLVATA